MVAFFACDFSFFNFESFSIFMSSVLYSFIVQIVGDNIEIYLVFIFLNIFNLLVYMTFANL